MVLSDESLSLGEGFFLWSRNLVSFAKNMNDL